MDAGVDYCGPVKMSHKGFCLATLENLKNIGRGGESYIVMNSTLRFPCGITLLEFG